MLIPAQTPLRERMRLYLELPPPHECRALRRSAGWSQQHAANRIGCDQTRISAYELGQAVPRGDLLYRYAALVKEWEAAL